MKYNNPAYRHSGSVHVIRPVQSTDFKFCRPLFLFYFLFFLFSFIFLQCSNGLCPLTENWDRTEKLHWFANELIKAIVLLEIKSVILVGDISAFLLVRLLGQCLSNRGKDVLVYIGLQMN